MKSRRDGILPKLLAPAYGPETKTDDALYHLKQVDLHGLRLYSSSPPRIHQRFDSGETLATVTAFKATDATLVTQTGICEYARYARSLVAFVESTSVG